MTKMLIDRSTVEQALEALETPIHEQSFMQKQNAITNLRTALAESAPDWSICPACGGMASDPIVPQRPAEPVAYSEGRTLHWHDGKGVNDAQLYLAPPQRKPLTGEEIDKAYREIWRDLPSDFDHTSSGWIEQGIRYAERAHGINYDNQDNKR